MNRAFKKSQMELMGIAIVAVLLSMILLFVVRFVILAPSSEVGRTYGESEQAANFLNTMLKTNAPDCSDVKFSTLIQDCTKNYPSGDILCDDGVNPRYSCLYLEDKLDILFRETLEEWKVDYYFVVYLDPNNEEDTKLDILGSGQKCTGDQRRNMHPLPLPPDNIYLALYICG